MAQTSTKHVLLDLASGADLKHLHDGESTVLVSGRLIVSLHESADGQWLVVSVAGFDVPFDKSSRLVTRGNDFIWPASQEIPDLKGEGYLELTLDPNLVSHEQIGMFESVLREWTAVEPLPRSRSASPVPTSATAPSASFPPEMRHQVVLLNEKGEVLGDLALNVEEDSDIDRPDSSLDPVVLEVTGKTVHIGPLRSVMANYGQSPSKIVAGAEYFSRGLILAAEKLGGSLQGSASNFAASRPPTSEPLVFHSSARKGVNGLLEVSNHAATISSKTFGMIGNMAGGLGAKVATAFSKPKPEGSDPPSGFKGALRNSVIALNTVIDSVEASGKHVWSQSTAAGAQVARHKYGADAGDTVEKLGGVGQNFALVYIDARGVGRTALLKNLGKGAVKARFSSGQEVVLQPDPRPLQVKA